MTLFDKIPPHADSVSSINFFCDNKYLVTTGLDGKITISDLDTYREPIREKLLPNAISSGVKVDDHTLVYCSNLGDIHFYDVLEKKRLKKITVKLNKTIKLHQPFNNSKYLFFSTDDKKLGIIDIEAKELLADDLVISKKPIISISLRSNDTLSILDARSSLYIYKLFNAEELSEEIDRGDFITAYDLAENNPLLKKSDEYLALEALFDKTFENAFKLFSRELYENALEVLAPFKDVPLKRAKISKLTKEFENYPTLLQYKKDKNYIRLYQMAERSEFLKETPAFLDVEKKWEESYKRAQEYVIKNSDKERAKLLLNDYYIVPSKRPIITALLRTPTLFIEVKTAIRNKDFAEFFSIVARNKFLKETPEYKSVIEYGYRLYQTISRKIKNRIFTNIIEEIHELEHFKLFDEELEALREFAKQGESFLRNFRDGNYPVCLELIDEYPFLTGFSEAKELELKWRSEVDKAHEAAIKGDKLEVVYILFPYTKVKTRIPTVGEAIKKAYLSQMKKAIFRDDKDQNTWEYSISKFISIFGYDSELDRITKELKKRGIEVFIGEDQKIKLKGHEWFTRSRGNLPDRIIQWLKLKQMKYMLKQQKAQAQSIKRRETLQTVMSLIYVSFLMTVMILVQIQRSILEMLFLTTFLKKALNAMYFLDLIAKHRQG
eukprot:TRINITY_DN53121_c0_g1_i1.p1 TRINITY_DN53121_c0_g1~~TRINITY_DN53121_c0_g1_i1.p1  ORF type:complete len:718 (+),score=57.47 TRINITY_DN53121_c0_g1_i1:164-2155(+)